MTHGAPHETCFDSVFLGDVDTEQTLDVFRAVAGFEAVGLGPAGVGPVEVLFGTDAVFAGRRFHGREAGDAAGFRGRTGGAAAPAVDFLEDAHAMATDGEGLIGSEGHDAQGENSEKSKRAKNPRQDHGCFHDVLLRDS